MLQNVSVLLPKGFPSSQKKENACNSCQFPSCLLNSKSITEAEKNCAKRSITAEKTLNLHTEIEGACLCNPLNSAGFVNNTETKGFC